MTDRNRELVPDSWSLVRERSLTTGLCSVGWYSGLPGVCRRAVEATTGMEIFAGNVIITLFVSRIPMGFMTKHMFWSYKPAWSLL